MELEAPQIAVVEDPETAARAAGLRYVSDRKPGIARKRAGKGFTYKDAKGERITDPTALARIKALVIPPAWTGVWISPWSNGHIQATGRDEKGRKQYRYHDRWRQVRDETKYSRMIEFGYALPKIREQVEHDLARRQRSKEKVIATVVRLLETTHIRIGNEEYARTNKSFGLTTMRCRHIKVAGKRVQFKFRGKSGKDHTITVEDRRLAKLVQRLQELPGQELFQFLDSDGKRHTITSDDVNAYLHDITGQHFTAKDFRTWAGTVLATATLQEIDPAENEKKGKRNIAAAVKEVASQLGNTPAVCRKAYIHPAILDTYLDGSMQSLLGDLTVDSDGNPVVHDTIPSTLKPEEYAVLYLLEKCQERDRRDAKSGAA